MLQCNNAATPAKTGAKMKRNDEEPIVDTTLYRQLIGSLRYLCNSRPDVSYSVELMSKFMEEPRRSYLIGAKIFQRDN